MKYYEGDGLLNSAINKLPFEMHIPGYNWCGPGTKVEKRLARNDPGVNGLDEACKEHDIAYTKDGDLSSRHEADKILKEKALGRLKAKDASWKEKLAALGVAGAMKAKVKLGMGLKLQNQQRTITNCKKKLQKIKQELLTTMKHVEEVIENIVANRTSNNGRKPSVNINKTKKRQGDKKKIVDVDIADDYPINKINNKTKTGKSIKTSREAVDRKKTDEMHAINEVQRKRTTIKKKRNSIKNRQEVNNDNTRRVEPLEELENIPMDVDIADDYPMTRVQRKRKIDYSLNDSEQPLCKRSSKLKAKRKVLDMNEPIKYPSRKRKLSATDDGIPEKVQVINTE